MNVTETLAELVAINSVSSRSNSEIIRYLARRLEARGLIPRLYPYIDPAGQEKTNLAAIAAPDAAAHEQAELALVGHTDTVPFGAGWTAATTLTARDEEGETRLYARGACDTKGFIAATLTAFETIDVQRLASPLALVFTADEEIGCVGAKHLADARPFTARHAIIGEPTSLQPIRAGKGYCLAEIIVRGQEGHSAHPERGASAIFRASRLITSIERLAAELQSDTHPAFDPPHTTVNVGLIRGGTAKNVLAGECRFTLEWRPIPGQEPYTLVRAIEAEVMRLKSEDAGFDATIEVIRIDGGIETREDAPLIRWMEETSGKSSGTVAFGTEAPQMKRLGAETIVFGPGDIRVAHTDREYVPQAELERCAIVLREAIVRFCA